MRTHKRLAVTQHQRRLRRIKPKLEQCDVLGFHGGAFISKAIRALTRTPGESKSWVNHVGFVYYPGPFYSACIQEAVTKVRRVSLSVYLEQEKRTEVRIYRPTLSGVELFQILRSADTTVGRRYGYGKIVLHALDSLVSRIVRRDINLFRRFSFSGHPICSWDLAHHWQAAGLSFGVAPAEATPDDIDDFCRSRPDLYDLIYEGEV